MIVPTATARRFGSKILSPEPAITDLSGGERTIDQFDGLVHGGLNSSKAGNDADIRPIVTKLPKRYERGEQHPHVHFTVRNGCL
jgi:hypothetical protein